MNCFCGAPAIGRDWLGALVCDTHAGRGAARVVADIRGDACDHEQGCPHDPETFGEPGEIEHKAGVV